MFWQGLWKGIAFLDSVDLILPKYTLCQISYFKACKWWTKLRTFQRRTSGNHLKTDENKKKITSHRLLYLERATIDFSVVIFSIRFNKQYHIFVMT